jgi:hypothetical protein
MKVRLEDIEKYRRQRRANVEMTEDRGLLTGQYNTYLAEEEMLGDLNEGGRSSDGTQNGP